ncbi:LOW QUALITY PROTEIN: serpin B11-like [Pluvialis apricaria]
MSQQLCPAGQRPRLHSGRFHFKTGQNTTLHQRRSCKSQLFPGEGLGHATMGSLIAANTKFCLDFFKDLNKVKRNEKIFFSPLSISAALSMVQLGARGNTAKEMEKVLHIHKVLSTANPETKSTTGKCEEAGGTHSQFQELSVLGKASATCSLSIANRLFGEVTFQFLQQYLGSTRALFHVELEAVDFISAAEESREKMNSRVEKQTSGKDKDCAWLPGECASGPCEKSIPGLDSAVTYEKLAEWTDMRNVYPQKITVCLPWFRMEESCELTAVLQALVRNAFILEEAHFSGLSSEPGLFLSKAIHKSFVEVNEEGTEAAAATGITKILCSCITYTFRADHPFLYLIKHNPSKNMLFFGQCRSP